MIPRKLVEIAFRRLWLLVLPVLAIPVIVALVSQPSSQYESSAVIWAASPPEGAPTFGHYNPYLSPAQNQANSLNDLLATESFKNSVAQQVAESTSHRPLAPEEFTVVAFSRGVNLLTIKATTGDAADARALVQSTIDQFQERSLNQVQRISGLSEEYYQQQLAIAQEELDRRRAAVDEYVRANPSAAKTDPANSPDLNYRALVARADQQATTVEQLQTSLQQAKLNAASAPEGQKAGFSVQDEPNLPTAPLAASTTRTIGFPFAGVVLGLLVAAGYLYVAFRTDHTIQSSEDIASLGVPVLGRVPELRPSRRLGLITAPWRRLTPRRQIDFARRTAANISSEPVGSSR